jgi:hypothetical protein
VLDVDERHALRADLGVRAEHGRVLLRESAADAGGTGSLECGHGVS